MIEKLKKHIGTIKAGNMTYDAMKSASINEMHEKINELVDAVNGILDYAPLEMAMKAERSENVQPDAKIRSENVQTDPYAEQRKWIGKVCWFWDDDNTNSSCGILTSIDTETFKEPQFVCNDEYDYEHCEPVKPDEDIIFKGE